MPHYFQVYVCNLRANIHAIIIFIINFTFSFGPLLHVLSSNSKNQGWPQRPKACIFVIKLFSICDHRIHLTWHYCWGRLLFFFKFHPFQQILSFLSNNSYNILCRFDLWLIDILFMLLEVGYIYIFYISMS